MTFKIPVLLLLVLNRVIKCAENANEEFKSYLIEHSNVRGIKVGEEVHWTLDLNGSYIIGSVRIHVLEHSLWNNKNLRMTVNDSKLHYCDKISIEENDWIVIMCNESLVIGRQLTISNNADQTNDTIKIHICSTTKHPIIKSYFTTDSSLVNNTDIVFDGDLKTCHSFDKWFNYSTWIAIDLKKEMFVESFVIIGNNYSTVKNIDILVTKHYTVDILPNNTLCNDSDDLLRCDKEGQFVLLKINPDNNGEFSICEIFFSGSKSHEKLDKKYGICNLKIKSHGWKDAWMVPLIILCCVLLFGMCFGAWRICKKKPRFWKYLNDSNLMQDLQANKLQYLVNKKLLNEEFDKEFSKLQTKDVKPSTIGSLASHVAKNRFGNVTPFDDNLVTLEGGENNYINASFIRGYKGVSRAYIATQGPLNNTLNDFWKLVWQFKVDVIVMLTQLSETCIDKCEQYWPDVDQGEAIFGKISVTIVKECQFADYVRRHLVIKMISPTESPRAVVHMHFLSWTDFHVPCFCFPLLEFREKVNSFQKHSKSPLVVHCSAGVGRTGTYIAIDYLIKQAELEDKVSIYKCIKDLRLQRMNMVQNKKQYIFIHKSLVEANMALKTGMHCIDFIRKFHDFVPQQSVAENKNQFIKEESEKYFRNLKNVVQIGYERTSAGSRTINLFRNRLKTVTVFDNHRLSMEIGASCARFINAVSIKCYKMSNACVLTQIPLPGTRSNFWQMLWENDLREVFLLDDDKKYAPYWPKKDAIAFGSLTICLTMEEKSSDYFVTRKFLLVDNSKLNPFEEDAKEVTQYHVTRHLWRENSQVPANKHEFQKILKQLVNNNKRIVLQCLDGSSRCGLTAAALLLIDMMLLDEVVDPFLACRYVLASRPEAISQEKFTFLYELALECIEDSGKYNFMRSNEYDLEKGM